ncbi:MAG: hypothetical protein HETSPECPRED_006564 [Heterodermia speciosa]|uniref:Uncharacterized protein n=1 Tax=Heterodermia speciosa TaxID=116794 RepID=A0A8H3FJZ3_9LECA|nr:MAG: hypothetical protein HETSPECPRED_006564 [Heterodermia speciosa]
MFGIIRLGYVAKSFHDFFHPAESFTNNIDTAPGFWTTAEVSVGVVAACLPPLSPLIRRVPSPRQLYRSLRGSPSRDGYVLERLDGSEHRAKDEETGVS